MTGGLSIPLRNYFALNEMTRVIQTEKLKLA
jgi:hypothetical protein